MHEKLLPVLDFWCRILQELHCLVAPFMAAKKERKKSFVRIIIIAQDLISRSFTSDQLFNHTWYKSCDSLSNTCFRRKQYVKVQNKLHSFGLACEEFSNS